MATENAWQVRTIYIGSIAERYDQEGGHYV